MGRREDDERQQREASRILKQVREETDPQTGAHAPTFLSDPARFLRAADADPQDRIEVMGRRIGRVLSLVGVVVLTIVLVVQLTQ